MSIVVSAFAFAVASRERFSASRSECSWRAGDVSPPVEPNHQQVIVQPGDSRPPLARKRNPKQDSGRLRSRLALQTAGINPPARQESLLLASRRSALDNSHTRLSAALR